VKNRQTGMTLIEMLMALAALSLLLLAVTAYAVPWIAREGTKGAIYDVQTYMQLARIEAVSRNRPVSLEVETALRRLQIVDSSGSVVLYERTLPGSVSFALPGGGSPVSLDPAGGNLYRLTFGQDGTVTAGQGAVALYGGDVYERASVYAAGGIEVEHWNGSSWQAGS